MLAELASYQVILGVVHNVLGKKTPGSQEETTASQEDTRARQKESAATQEETQGVEPRMRMVHASLVILQLTDFSAEE